MEHLPIYISTVFILTTLLTLFTLYKAGGSSRLIFFVIIWLAAQAVIGLTGFYTSNTTVPPRFALLLIPPIVFITILFLTKGGKAIIAGFDLKTLTLLHIVRIPVELTLFWLYQQKAIPQVMTFEGHNFDILCGLTAPLVYYFGFVKNVLSRYLILAWNVICLLVLANIVVTAVLSAPLPFQQFGFDQPNIAMLYFPFIWLPCFVVPAVLFAHLVTIKRLLTRDSQLG